MVSAESYSTRMEAFDPEAAGYDCSEIRIISGNVPNQPVEIVDARGTSLNKLLPEGTIVVINSKNVFSFSDRYKPTIRIPKDFGKMGIYGLCMFAHEVGHAYASLEEDSWNRKFSERYPLNKFYGPNNSYRLISTLFSEIKKGSGVQESVALFNDVYEYSLAIEQEAFDYGKYIAHLLGVTELDYENRVDGIADSYKFGLLWVALDVYDELKRHNLTQQANDFKQEIEMKYAPLNTVRGKISAIISNIK